MGQGLFVPNDTTLDCDENRMIIITGRQYGRQEHLYAGKNALICLMAQIGCFVPRKRSTGRHRGQHLHPGRRFG